MKVPKSWKNCKKIFESHRLLMYNPESDLVELEYYLTLWKHNKTKKIYCNILMASVNDPKPKFYSSNMFSIKLIKELHEKYIKDKKSVSK